MTNPVADGAGRGPSARGFVDAAFNEVLAGTRVLITAQRRAEDLSAALKRRGAHTVVAPSMGVEHHIDEASLLGRTRDLLDSPPDAVVVTTGIGLRAWLDAADTAGLSEALSEMLGATSTIARGPKAVGALRGAGADPAWVSPRASSHEILEHLLETGVAGRHVVIQCHGAGDDGLSEALREAGARVTPLTVYRWGPPPDADAVTNSIDELRAARFDAVAFTSSPGSAAWVSSLEAAKALGNVREQNLSGGLLLAAVGQVAAGPLVDAGFDVGCPERGRMGALVRYISTRITEDALTCVIPAGLLRVHATDAALGQRALGLAPGGLAVARLLASHPGRTVSREQILHVLPGDSTDPHAAEVAIARLREALASPASIRTGVRRGYLLVDAS